MRVTRRRGVLKLSLDEVEAAVLGQLIDEVDELVDTMAADDAVTQRLFPSAHRDDEEATRQFRELTESGLRELRQVRYGVLRAALPMGGGTIEIAEDDETAWLTTLNDIRLALGTRIGVTEDEPEIDAGDPEAAGWSLYYWLTGLQDSLVRAAMK